MSHLDVVNPATGNAFASVATSTVADCLGALDIAAEALRSWAHTPPQRRCDVLQRAADLMLAETDQLAATIVAENGKVLSEARAEVAYAAAFLRWFAGEAIRIDGDCRVAPGGDKRILVTRGPIGVCVLVTPWNFPAAMATRKLGPALAAGCTAVLKPAPHTPLTALALVDVLRRAGLPDGVASVVLPEPPGEAVAAMLAHPAVRKLSFTGSTAVGAALLAEAAPHVLSVSMELGGNGAFLVLDDADVDVAVAAALAAKLRNGGASCTAANRFYVHDAVADEFSDRLTDAMSAIVVDDGMAPGAQLGPLVSAAERDKVGGLVEAATAEGARATIGGRLVAREGFFYPPTVLVDVDPDAPILGREIFGPVAPIVRFGDLDAAIAQANDTAMGLMSFVCSRDLGRCLQVADRLDAGMVAVNRGVIADPAAPFGGVKHSGLGREGGFEGIDAFLEQKYIGVDW